MVKEGLTMGVVVFWEKSWGGHKTQTSGCKEAAGRGRRAKAGRELNGVYFRKGVNWRDGKKVFTLRELGVESKEGLSSAGTGTLLAGSEKKKKNLIIAAMNLYTLHRHLLWFKCLCFPKLQW